MAYANAGKRIASIQNKVKEYAQKEQVAQLQRAANERLMTVKNKLASMGENLKSWLCWGRDRHQNKQYTSLEKIASLITGQLIDALSPTEEEHDRLPLLPKLPEPSAQMPERALSRESKFRRSGLGPGGGGGSTGATAGARLSRYSIDYSDYIFDKYGKPSPAVECFFNTTGGGETSPILRSISQRTGNRLYCLRRTRSSETIAPSAVAMFTRTDTIGSTLGKRLDGWLLKQEEYFAQEKAVPASTLHRSQGPQGLLPCGGPEAPSSSTGQ
ncbi:hypothetical protein C7212DRAFT_364833 [Tuber magnatum]|uniref:Uncharacterized protein n=1 Tax=Tuber magnatum TaxID=42249 RepID=A0A317SLG5_9PEZI|nr:hypothetical protein C7212DRAFT_364833 [Tuber magnatum]